MSCIDAAIIKAMTSDYAPAEHTHNRIGNNLTVDGSLDVKQSIVCGNSRIASDSTNFAFYHNENCVFWAKESEFHALGRITATNGVFESLLLSNPGTNDFINMWLNNNGQIIAQLNSTQRTETLFGGSRTITHATNVQGAIGTFAESTGEIYDGYEKIGSTDCICKVKQDTTLNARIVGVIVDKDTFASHGDCLVKIVPGAYSIGDILVPDASGFARKATDEELTYMMTHAIPRPKITSLETGIDGMAACFIV